MTGKISYLSDPYVACGQLNLVRFKNYGAITYSSLLPIFISDFFKTKLFKCIFTSKIAK